MKGKDVQKTNAARLLDRAKIAYSLVPYAFDPDDLAASHVAEQLGVTKPSVTYTTKRLRENGYITMDKDGFITLSESGMQIASSMLERHRMLSSFLMALGVDKETALQDACRMEHDMSQQTFDALCAHVKREQESN